MGFILGVLLVMSWVFFFLLGLSFEREKSENRMLQDSLNSMIGGYGLPDMPEDEL
jgi:hypothetical protein